MKSFEKIDFLINVAGTNLCVPMEEIKPEEWDRVMDINLKSFYLLSQSVLEIMKKNNFGRIVNVSSIAGRTKSLVSGVHYTASKYGVIGLTKQLAHECSKYNILVNCTCPSQTKTEMLQNSMNEQLVHRFLQWGVVIKGETEEGHRGDLQNGRVEAEVPVVPM